MAVNEKVAEKQLQMKTVTYMIVNDMVLANVNDEVMVVILVNVNDEVM
jgi:hypothetical protein